MAQVTKDPDETLDFVRDWQPEDLPRETWPLPEGDTIATSTWIVPAGITKVEEAPRVSSKTGTTTTVWLSGGTLRETYRVVNRVETTGGRVLDATLYVTVLAA